MLWLTIDRTAIKKALRPLAQKVLESKTPNAIDRNAVDLIFTKIDFWNRGQTHLERIFERLNAESTGVTIERFTAEATKYAEEVAPSEKANVNRLILLARLLWK
jgi:hypothetical protein